MASELLTDSQGNPPRIRPRARIMRTLGDELISSEAVAVIELVKNSWDADATRVLVRLNAPLEVGTGGIDVLDDGVGMSPATVLGAWLEPATGFKRSETRSEETARRVLGEKGIGRFAVSRLADELELMTRRSRDTTETHAIFEWSAFDDPDAYLDEVPIVVESSDPADIAPGGLIEVLWRDKPAPAKDRLSRGTILRMTGLRTSWDRRQIAELRQGLARLVSPFIFESDVVEPTFRIFLEAPQGFDDLSGDVGPPDALRAPHYSLSASFAADGVWTGTMSIRDIEPQQSISGHLGTVERPPACGPFRLELRVWDRDQASMTQLAGRFGTKAARVREDLDQAAGVNVYRDGFRVLPYGDRGDDWLQLDSRRVNNPTLRLSNNQVAGYVLIGADANPDLRDQTNREGLIDNQAFADLRLAVREIIARLEAARYGARPREKRERKRGPIFDGINVATISQYIGEKYPADRPLRRMLGETEEQIEASIERVEEVVARYRRLATLGQLIDKVLHDGGTPLGSIRNQTELALRIIDRGADECEERLAAVGPRLRTVLEQQEVLATVFRRIQPFGGRKRGQPRSIELEQVLRDTFALEADRLSELGIAVDLPETHTSVRVDPAELQEVFINLLQNSLYWLERSRSSEARILVDVERLGDEIQILFADSGPGVPEEHRDSIFDPYFSLSEGRGQGLGLTLAGEIVDEYYGGDLDLLPGGPLSGANFRIVLRRRV